MQFFKDDKSDKASCADNSDNGPFVLIPKHIAISQTVAFRVRLKIWLQLFFGTEQIGIVAMAANGSGQFCSDQLWDCK